MEKTRVVLALGGNALGNSPEEQKEAVKTTAQSIADLIRKQFQSNDRSWKRTSSWYD